MATPVLVSTLTELESDAEAVGGELVLDSQLPLAEKVPALLGLAESAEGAEASVPDVEAVLEHYETGSGAVSSLAERLADVLDELVTRAFREPFLVCACFGLLGALLALGFRREGGRVRAPPIALVALAVGGSGVALAVDFRLGALDDPAPAADPCTAEPVFRGSSFDETTQRVALAALAGAACELETSRTGLLRALSADEPLPWPREEVEEAVRNGLVAAIDVERERGTLNAVLGVILRAAA